MFCPRSSYLIFILTNYYKCTLKLLNLTDKTTTRFKFRNFLINIIINELIKIYVEIWPRFCPRIAIIGKRTNYLVTIKKGGWLLKGGFFKIFIGNVTNETILQYNTKLGIAYTYQR